MMNENLTMSQIGLKRHAEAASVGVSADVSCSIRQRRKLSKSAYERLIAEDLEWLDSMPDCLERQHIEHIVKDSIKFYYPKAN